MLALTLVKMLLTVPPSAVTATTQTTAISASSKPYSTSVWPSAFRPRSSRAKKLRSIEVGPFVYLGLLQHSRLIADDRRVDFRASLSVSVQTRYRVGLLSPSHKRAIFF